MTDRELLELAAKAAGIEIHESDDGTVQRRPVWAITHYVQGQPYGEVRWDPIHDDAQALRLAVKLEIDIFYQSDEAGRFTSAEGKAFAYQHHKSDPYAATRRAIVRAAAEIGKSQGEPKLQLR